MTTTPLPLRPGPPRPEDAPDIATEEALDRLVRLAARALRAPIAYLALVDGGRQSVRHVVGLPDSFPRARDLPLDHLLSDEVIEGEAPLLVEDLRKSARAHDMPLIGEGAVALLALPLRGDPDRAVAVLGVMDRVPRAWTPDEVEILGDLAGVALAGLRAHGRPGGPRSGGTVRESEERFRSLIENAADVITIVSAGGAIDYVTPSVERVLGYAPAQLAGKSAFALLHPADAPSVIEHFARLVRGAACEGPADCRVRHQDGSWRTLEVRVNNLLHDSAVAGMVVNARDITDARRAQNTKHRLQAFLEATPDFVATFDPHGRALSVNAAFRRVAAVGPDDDLARLTIADLFPPSVTERILHEGIPEANRAGIWSGETILHGADGVEIPISQVILAHRSADGTVEFLSTLARDITERKRAEEEVVEQRAFYEQILENIDVDIAVFDGDCRYEYVNRNAVRDPETRRWIVGKNDFEYVAARGRSPEIAESRTERMRAVIRDGVGTEFEEQLVDAAGELRSIVRKYLPILDRDGAVARLIGYGFDITDRKRAEEERRRSVALLHEAEKIAHMGSWEWDAATGELNWSDEMYRVHGLEPADGPVSADFYLDRIHPDDREAVRTTIERALVDHLPYTVDHRIVLDDGSLRNIHGRGRVVTDAGGAVLRLMGSGQDVTEQVAAGAALRESQEQLVQAQKMEAVGRLAGGIAHDFNNLLTAIKGFTELLLLDFDERDPRHAFVTEIQGAASRAAALTRQLLAFSRKQVLQPRVLDLNASVSDIETMLRRLLGEDIRLETVQERRLGRVKADPSQIEQVLVNLAVNARDAMPGGGRIVVSTANVELAPERIPSRAEVAPGPYVVLSVADTGSGMSPEVQARIFEPFYTTKPKGKGTGLGLSTVYGIVQQSGGLVQVESAPGEGTTFRVYLPRVQEEVEAGAGRAPDPRPVTGSETVLVVEDEDAVRVLVRRVLERNGYRVLEAGSGADALRLLDRNADPVHLLLTDVVMPGMSGRELADRLAPLHPAMRIVYMSGYTDEDIVNHGVLDGGIALIEKPFTPDLLLRRLREILDAPVPPAGG